MINVLCVALVYGYASLALAVEVSVSSAVLTNFFVKLRCRFWLKHHQRYQIMTLVSTLAYHQLLWILH